ncbi:HNH endonuclease [Brevibacillus porteri]|uniref:Gp5/Type VI secretion system Vgr protein OB-fold domain-containing protein n=1 Tax=Brevibacillus porteri TaxID=2126350 RepID=A0ABX5FV50_9BACL|nr:HNH endonuclease [Brevibacillus porteri]MED1798054.1 HNH endonuclease [Brevibacillus porteri]MED2132111.1 HNH endonuclease [Brevibacillus porteri]MED2742674.1 HNH endonuclease [Brevibacillus porteri]MED2814150.1 HNH endonuclease [Brevibacillus porteri]MED2893711.1 HNH endonuclease [Brevibacillus porteri]
MKTTEKLAGYENIQLVSPFEIQSLQDVRIVKKVNEHARLFVTGIIPEEKSDRYIEMATSEDTVALNLVENGSLTKTLFKGLVDSVSVNFIHGVYHLELEAVSHTQRMDGQRKLRSFQNKKMSYASLLDEITKDYPGSDYLDHASNGAPLGTIAIQYQETDWQFLKRLASRFGSILVAEAVADTPKFWFGLPEGRTAQLTDASYTVSKRLSPYMETTENGYAAGMSENDFLTYEVESGQVLQLGDRVNYQGKELVVAGSTTRIDHALLIHTYQLMPEAGIRQNPIRNDDICGAALEGKIIDIQKDTVKIHLNIDPKQPKAEASWFPYATVYSAEGNSGFHCMPQMGDSVKLYFSTPDEEGAMAVSSVRKGGGSTAKTGNPGIKYWGTNFGKELMMGGKELVLTAKESEEGNIFIKLHEEDGIEIHSMHPIVFSSEKDMEITSDTKVEIKAKEAIYLMCSTSSMILDGEVDLQAPKIEMVGLTKAPVVVEDLPQEEEEEEEQQEEEESGWGGFLDGVQLALDVVGLIPGLGEIADLANAGISLARGDYAGAALSLAACIPFAGWAATGAKLGAKAHKALKGTKAGQKVLEVADSAADVVKNVANAVESTVGKVWTAARKTLDEMDVMQAVQRIKEQLYASVMAAKDAVINKATQMKEQLKQKARKLRDDMQEGLQNVADSLGPQLQSAEGFPIKFSNKKDVVELAPTENQLKWRETYGGPNGQKPNQKPPEKPPETKSKPSKEEQQKAIDKAMEDAARNQPAYTRVPNKPRTYKNKVRNEDGTTTYTFVSKKNGKEYKVTYDKAGFPIFNSKHEISLPEKLYLEPDGVQFDYLSKKLYEEIIKNPDLAKKFTKEEIELFKNGSVPKTLTWHHHQDSGRMQIVDYFEHQVAGHTGGRAIWGGGEAGRKGQIKKKILEMLSWD